MPLSPKVLGIIEALLSATFFGLIPILFLPIYAAGITAEANLIYRFAFAALMMLIPIKLKKHSLQLPLKTHISIALGGFSYYLAALFLYSSLTHIASGVTVTIFFTNPIFVMLVMAIFYKEKIEPYKIILSLTALGGIALFSGVFQSDIVLNPTGIFLALLSSMSFAFYVLALFKLQCAQATKESISFYIFFYCALFAYIYSIVSDTFVLPTTPFVWLLLVLSALITAILPNVLLMTAMKKIGSVLATVLGVMEPITAVLIGILVFDEVFDMNIVLGIIIVIVSVMLITLLSLVRKTR